jgi:hypothetical protein
MNQSEMYEIGDLIRLGIISPAESTMASKTGSNAEYALTHYGVSFIRAVSGNAGATDKGGFDETARPSDSQDQEG